ncbi:hypothetical protein D6C79_08706 [Aureobasidium pullulans]|nr:hypothetical protein D6C79_08706 [Aureobasidium pullulans]
MFGDFLMHGDAGSATLLRPETMTASAAKWLHRYHQIIKWHEQEERGLCNKSRHVEDLLMTITPHSHATTWMRSCRHRPHSKGWTGVLDHQLSSCCKKSSQFTKQGHRLHTSTNNRKITATMAAIASTLTSNPWFFEPLQIFATLGAAVNFGGSVLQSPLIMPTVTDHVVGVPIHYTAQQTAYLLHNSEHFFPPLNALCSLSNLILTSTAFLRARDGNLIAEAKFPKLAAAFGLNVATTAWALLIQVPMNKRMSRLAEILKEGVANGTEKDSRQKAAEKEFRDLQLRWRKLNYGRAAIMIASAVAGALALVAKP